MVGLRNSTRMESTTDKPKQNKLAKITTLFDMGKEYSYTGMVIAMKDNILMEK